MIQLTYFLFTLGNKKKEEKSRYKKQDKADKSLTTNYYYASFC